MVGADEAGVSVGPRVAGAEVGVTVSPSSVAEAEGRRVGVAVGSKVEAPSIGSDVRFESDARNGTGGQNSTFS